MPHAIGQLKLQYSMLSCFGHALKTNSTLVSPDVLAHQGAF